MTRAMKTSARGVHKTARQESEALPVSSILPRSSLFSSQARVRAHLHRARRKKIHWNEMKKKKVAGKSLSELVFADREKKTPEDP